jgi:hypothetical protein
MNRKVIFPTIHCNGTRKRALFDQYIESMKAIQIAAEKIPEANRRDYYPQGGDAMNQAIEQRYRWLNTLNDLHNEIEAVAIKITEQ